MLSAVQEEARWFNTGFALNYLSLSKNCFWLYVVHYAPALLFLFSLLQHSINDSAEPRCCQVHEMFCLSSETVVLLRWKGEHDSLAAFVCITSCTHASSTQKVSQQMQPGLRMTGWGIIFCSTS